MAQRYQLFINNEWVDPLSDQWFDSLDPFRLAVERFITSDG